MTKKLSLLILSAVMSFACSFAQTNDATAYQSPQIVLSTKKASINGSMYYVHKIQPKETLYSICKAYNVSEKVVTKVNDINGGLLSGNLLFIPCMDEAGAPEENNGNSYINYRVKWYDNLYTISESYDVPVSTLQSINDLKGTSVKKGQIIKIPVSGTVPSETYIADESEITVDDNNSGKKEEKNKITVHRDEERVEENIREESDSEEIDDYPYDNSLFRKNARVALILPFDASSSPSSNYFDFYSGFLMAVNKMKENGMNIELSVIDFTNAGTLNNALNDGELEKCDLIIGPVTAKSIPEFANFCDRKKIAFVSPMDPKAESLASEYHYFFQVPASANTQIENMVKSIQDSQSRDRILVIYDKSSKDTLYSNGVFRSLNDKNINYETIGYDIHGGRTIIESIRAKLSRNSANRIIVASEQEAFASDAIRNINLLSLEEDGHQNASFEIITYGSHKIRNFSTIESEAFHNTNMHIFSAYGIDYASKETVQFITQYRALFSGEPTPYSFQGYDIGSFFLKAVRKLGKNFTKVIDRFTLTSLQSNMHFERVGDNKGFINKASREIIYLPDYTIEVK